MLYPCHSGFETPKCRSSWIFWIARLILSLQLAPLPQSIKETISTQNPTNPPPYFTDPEYLLPSTKKSPTLAPQPQKFNTQISHQLSPLAKENQTPNFHAFPTKTQPNITIPLLTSIEQRERGGDVASPSQASLPNPNTNSRLPTSQAPRS
ncbi:hypothetical protein GBA52_008074 [Prunus armeniaca]|nr:hypothetical protein GBA52_008074 [Prunus armeniaca]